MKKATLVALVLALTAGGLAACRGELVGPGISDQGNFFVNINGHSDTTHKGGAAFYKNVEDGVETLTLYFVNDGARFELVFTMRDFTGQIETYDLETDPDRYEGTYAYWAGGQRVHYTITGGNITIESSGRALIEGSIEFEGIATNGPNPGGTSRVVGTFKAVCEGDCLGTVPPPPV